MAVRCEKISHNAVWLFLRREAELQKTLFDLKLARTDIARRRQRWRSWQAGLNPQRLVFIEAEAEKKSIQWIDCPPMVDQDQYGTTGGWGPKGKRLRGLHGMTTDAR